jgi:hypothetical protein
VPLASSSNPGIFGETKEGAAHGVRGYRYETARTTHYVFFSEGNGIWSCGAWSSDAQLLYCRLEDGRLAGMAVVAGSFAKWQERPMFSHREQVERFEWLHVHGAPKTFSSCPDALAHAINSRFELLDPVH